MCLLVGVFPGPESGPPEAVDGRPLEAVRAA
jgi:hypothetical protein